MKQSRLAARLRTLRGVYLNHRFDRASPLDVIPSALRADILGRPVVLPPRSWIGQPGMQSLEGLVFLAALVGWLNPSRVLEIGTFRGVTTACLALNMAAGEVHTVDLPDEAAPRFTTDKSDEFRASHRVPMCYEEPSLGLSARVRQHWADSADFDFEGKIGTCDLVYIDGAHSEPYVRSDSESAFRLLAASGAVVWDDYWRQAQGVAKVLHELAHERRLWRVPDTRLVVCLSGAPEGAS